MNRPSDRRQVRPAGQRGVVLLFALISLVVLLIGAVALMRSFNTALFTAGNIAFKRDLQNQGERAIDVVKTAFATAGTLPAASRTASINNTTQCYSAAMLPVNSQGVPLALSDNSFSVCTLANTDTSGVTSTYVIDRLCNAVGDTSTLGAVNCVVSGAPPSGTSGNNLLNAATGAGGNAGAAQLAVVYRVSMRVTGPRNTVAYFQSTIAAP